MVRVGINGFGRIGRNVFRAALQNPQIEVTAINDLADVRTLAHLLKYDTTHGRFESAIEVSSEGLFVNGKHIRVYSEREPELIPWGDLGIQVVVESTGRFTTGEKASFHLKSGARKVIISAPSTGEDITLVPGVNENQYEAAKHHIISNASCTTNCLAPLAKVLNDQFTIIKGMMTTVHAYTNDQNLLDLPHKDIRRARAAAENIVPTSTGAARSISIVIPELQGKLNGFALRVPNRNVSVVDLVVQLSKSVTRQDVNDALLLASQGELKGIMLYSEEPLVSSDYNGNPASSIIDGLSTMVVGENLVKVVAWYDNEWGYSNRVVDTIAFLDKQSL